MYSANRNLAEITMWVPRGGLPYESDGDARRLA